MTDINVGKLSESINNKADLDLGNTNPLARTVVEVSDKSLMPSWYRVYSDGWCEQGGIINNQDGLVTITFSKNFLNINYIPFKTINWNETEEGIVRRYVGFHNKTTSTMQTYSYTTPSTNTESWQASGYIN